MELPAYFNVPDFIKIGVISMIFIFLANMMLRKIGLPNFTVSE